MILENLAVAATLRNKAWKPSYHLCILSAVKHCAQWNRRKTGVIPHQPKALRHRFDFRNVLKPKGVGPTYKERPVKHAAMCGRRVMRLPLGDIRSIASVFARERNWVSV